MDVNVNFEEDWIKIKHADMTRFIVNEWIPSSVIVFVEIFNTSGELSHS